MHLKSKSGWMNRSYFDSQSYREHLAVLMKQRKTSLTSQYLILFSELSFCLTSLYLNGLKCQKSLLCPNSKVAVDGWSLQWKRQSQLKYKNLKKSGTRTVKVPLDFPMVDQRDCRRQGEALVFQAAPIVSDSEQSDDGDFLQSENVQIVQIADCRMNIIRNL